MTYWVEIDAIVVWGVGYTWRAQWRTNLHNGHYVEEAAELVFPALDYTSLGMMKYHVYHVGLLLCCIHVSIKIIKVSH